MLVVVSPRGVCSSSTYVLDTHKALTHSMMQCAKLSLDLCIFSDVKANSRVGMHPLSPFFSYLRLAYKTASLHTPHLRPFPPSYYYLLLHPHPLTKTKHKPTSNHVPTAVPSTPVAVPRTKTTTATRGPLSPRDDAGGPQTKSQTQPRRAAREGREAEAPTQPQPQPSQTQARTHPVDRVRRPGT